MTIPLVPEAGRGNSHGPVIDKWRILLSEAHLPSGGTIVEVAPGYEMRIGVALSSIHFRGEVILVEPDAAAAACVVALYQALLPDARVKTVVKRMQDIVVGQDVPYEIDALVANHALDDMVISEIVGAASETFFSDERRSGLSLTPEFAATYESMTAAEYDASVMAVTRAWLDAIDRLNPHYVAICQYPSRKLAAKGLQQRQDAGQRALAEIRRVHSEVEADCPTGFTDDDKTNPKWWLVVNR